MYDTLATIFAFSGLICAIVNYEVDIGNRKLIIYEVDIITKNYKNALDTDRFRDGNTALFRYFILLTTILAFFCLIIRHLYKIQWINKYFNLALKKEMNHNARSLTYFYNQAIVGDYEDLTDSKKNNLIK